MKFFILCLLALGVLVVADQASFDCKMRQLGMDFARKIQPFRTKEQFQQIADALNGAQEANHCSVSVPAVWTFEKFPYFPFYSSEQTFYIDSQRGSDTNPGTMAQPFATINKGILSARAAGSGSTLVLRSGTFYLSSTLQLTNQDNGLTIQNYPGEEVWISGGVLLHPTWKPSDTGLSIKTYTGQNDVFGRAVSRGNTTTIKYLGQFQATADCQTACLNYKVDGQMCNSYTHHTDAITTEWKDQCFANIDHYWQPVPQAGVNSGQIIRKNIYVADLNGDNLSDILGLRINGKRSIRARYPNADPEFGFGSTLSAKSWLPPTIPPRPDIQIRPDTPFRDTSYSFQKFQMGIGGSCAQFDPPAGYWCGNQTEGGGAFTYRIPSGMVADQSVLPNSPYKDPIGAVVQSWRPYHWASWMFEVGAYSAQNGQFKFSKGGFQGARGENTGEHFYIENVFEELDSPNEWFFDRATKQLYLFYNGTGVPPTTLEIVATNLKTLLTITGTQQNPAKNINVLGLNFRDTVYTYLDPHGMPSGGDWGLQRSAAVILEGTEKVVVDRCTFRNLDGNGLLISAYNRYATIKRSEFVWIGDSAIISWGNAKGTAVPGMGWDGTGGDQPRFNQILNNLVHELGIWEKQSSFYFQAKTCQTLMQGNIFFNGPRAGINFNDGFGGGSNLTENFLFNTCRESSDHGPFNSWDRQVYVTEVLNGKPSVLKQWDYIQNNFVIANYNSQEAIDNDDGSCYYETHHNFLAYSGNGMKSDFGGHDNHHHDNIYAYVGNGFEISSQLEGHSDYFYANKVILTRDGNYGSGQTCQGAGKTVVHDNQIFTPTGVVTECGTSLKDWQSKGNDIGTTAAKQPTDDVLVGWIKDLLQI